MCDYFFFINLLFFLFNFFSKSHEYFVSYFFHFGATKFDRSISILRIKKSLMKQDCNTYKFEIYVS